LSNFTSASIARDSKKEKTREKEVCVYENAIGGKFNVEKAKYNLGYQKEE